MRWLKFNAVGVIGAVVQLSALWIFEHFTRLPAILAVALAVEIAILHNFMWHEAWTWKDKPSGARWRRLARFHLANGLLSITSNVVLTAFYLQIAGLPLVAANLAAIVTASLVSFWVAHAWVFRGLVFLALMLPHHANAAVITTTLQPQTVVAWNTYIANFERQGPGPLIETRSDHPKLIDLNVNGDVPDGFIHHWIGAELIPNMTVDRVEKVLRDYADYTRIYGPDLKFAEGKANDPATYDVRLITERVEGFLHFAFDIHSRVVYRHSGPDRLIESRSYLIRESDSGHAPYTDLMPEGMDHGILWRLNSYWRLRQMDGSVYAECQAISLSRRPLFGTSSQVKNRAKDSLQNTLIQTKARAIEKAR